MFLPSEAGVIEVLAIPPEGPAVGAWTQIGPYDPSCTPVCWPGGAGLAHLRLPVGGAAKRMFLNT